MWVLALLTVMALALTQIQRTEGALTANQLDRARFRAHAAGIMNLVALDLLSTPATTFDDAAIAWIPDGRAQPFRFNGEDFIVTLSNQGSKFDLNTIERPQLLTLIELAQDPERPDELQRDQLADAILDWRDDNDLARLNGAEDADYAAVGLPYGAADRPFRSVEELRQVLGMPASLHARLAPYLRVESNKANSYAAFSAGQGAKQGQGQVDETFATAPVLVALHGHALEEAQRLVEERFQGLFADDDEGQRAPLDRGGPRYHLQITHQRPGGGGPTMEALIHVEPANPAAFEVLWQRFGAKAANTDSDSTSGSNPDDGAVAWP
ncbi:general secretion pathway protein GspK [Halochromatium salexigens]|nr:type II secretion system protein GspK [Halochromatium salexigens]